jgi:hypothetical protein
VTVLLLAILGLFAAGSSGASPPSAPQMPTVSLIEARLTKVEDITGQPGAPCICDESGNLLLDGSFRLFFSPIRTLAGPGVRVRLSYDQASAQPVVGSRWLLVVTHKDDANVIVWRDVASNGLCLESDEISAYGLERAAQKLPCRN